MKMTASAEFPAELNAYKAFVDEIDQLAARLTARYRAHLLCQAGCSGCCHHHLSVFPIEAISIQTAIESLSAESQQQVQRQAESVTAKESRHEAVRCPLLIDDRCSIYEARPLICRTQGLPLLYETEDGAQEVDFCPLNFTSEQAVNDLDENQLVPLDALNLKLAALNLQYCRTNDLPDEKAVTRISMADIILQIPQASS